MFSPFVCKQTSFLPPWGWLVVFCWLVQVNFMPAQTTDLLSETRRAYQTKLLTESQRLTEQYVSALAKLEIELAQAAEYEEALRVQQRREELEALYAQSSATSSQSILLSPDLAKITGTTEARGDLLIGWRTSTSSAEWSNIRVTTSSYYLDLEACFAELPNMPGDFSRSQPQEKASFVFYEPAPLPGAAENRRSFELSLSRDTTTFTPIRVGPIQFTRTPVTLRLAPESGYPGNLVRLRKLSLTEIKDEVITAPSQPRNVDSIANSKKQFYADLRTALNPVILAYQQKLVALATGSPSLKDISSHESRRLANLLREEKSKNDAHPLSRILSQNAGVAGFENLDNARLVTADTVSGDHLVIEHEGQRLPIRLLWIRCAPMDEKDDSRKALSKHFGMDLDGTSALARTAREFSMGYLDGKPLRLLLRPGKDKDGSQAALLFLPDVGLYQNVLVQQGLAAVQTPAKEIRRGIVENSLISTLLELEESAKRLKNGAWSLGTEEVKP